MHIHTYFSPYTADLVIREDRNRQQKGKSYKWLQTILEEWEDPGVGVYTSAFSWLDN